MNVAIFLLLPLLSAASVSNRVMAMTDNADKRKAEGTEPPSKATKSSGAAPQGPPPTLGPAMTVPTPKAVKSDSDQKRADTSAMLTSLKYTAHKQTKDPNAALKAKEALDVYSNSDDQQKKAILASFKEKGKKDLSWIWIRI